VPLLNLCSVFITTIEKHHRLRISTRPMDLYAVKAEYHGSPDPWVNADKSLSLQ